MPILRVGVDLIEIERIERAMERFGERFLHRCYTEGERAYCRERAERYASRFAAKEAASKVLGTGIGFVSWLDIEVVRERSGRPTLQLHRNAAKVAAKLGLTTWEVSLTHSRGDAMAFIVAMGGDS